MPDTAQPALRLEMLEGDIAVLTFDQPGSKANTLSSPIWDEFEAVLQRLNAPAGRPKGLILRSGKPGMFVAGADLRELGTARPDPDVTRKLIRRGHDILAAFESLPYPTVAVIDGSCMGGGLELALAFDFRLAGSHPKTELGLPEVKLGILPGWGGTQRLTRLIGPALAAELICAGEAVKAERARDLHIVFDAVPSERLMEEALRVLRWAQETGSWQEVRQRKR